VQGGLLNPARAQSPYCCLTANHPVRREHRTRAAPEQRKTASAELAGRILAAPVEYPRPRAQQASPLPVRWKVSGPDCLRTRLRPRTGALRRFQHPVSTHSALTEHPLSTQ
jgi:hypothetical protein